MSGPRLVVVGAGGFARETVEIAQGLQPGTPVAFVDDAPREEALALMSKHGADFLGAARSWIPAPEDVCVIAIGDPSARASLSALLAQRGATFTVLVHPDATVAASAVLHPGVIVAPGARVSADVVLGEHVHVDQNATIGHDSTVGAHSRINPMACVSGGVVIGDGTYVGAAAVVLQGLTLGAGSLIGAGAVVTRDVAEGVIVKGVPAR